MSTTNMTLGQLAERIRTTDDSREALRLSRLLKIGVERALENRRRALENRPAIGTQGTVRFEPQPAYGDLEAISAAMRAIEELRSADSPKGAGGVSPVP